VTKAKPIGSLHEQLGLAGLNYWLLKSEPDVFGYHNLLALGTAMWDGVRNAQARNFLAQTQAGDLGFFYHSQSKPPHIAGILRVLRPAFADPTQFNPNHAGFDPRSSRENPRWLAVEVQPVQALPQVLTLERLRQVRDGDPALRDMLLFRHSRLSVQPVSQEAWQSLLLLANIDPAALNNQ
jgi:predicted RNA-binding protein with PUA-like domain